MMNWIKQARAIGVVLAAFPAIALAQVVAPTSPALPAVTPLPGAVAPSAATSQAEYVLGPEDVVEVEVVGTSDRTRARIYSDGSIQVNLIGRITAAGRTPRELGAEIARTLKAGGYYAEPIVNVEVSGYASRYVTVLGSVVSPGLVPINRPYRLSEILARVGGVRDGAADYLIVRPENGEEKRYDVEKIASGAVEDPVVAAGDKIFSPPAELIYVNGQVNSPGSFPIKTGMTIAQAIAKAGGLTESGTDKKVKVRRGDKSLKLGPSDKVEAGDVLTISERLF